ncbi:manganese ABC transporter ATP-binding protein [Enterococcus saigonensis]|uniref:Manganese ABC transporter ATP-binding protein n=1 Tax=Enterococcus saigonensis TaxID=1805431 RepID=A0A679IBR5_9ENTE|nr:metal ABC transporter ATP-binding protein [Enterococcus saigonensis]BCA85703.1 manganese ABC transporter ATP-binding protein [Enterococcus saigonensis]
MIRFENITAAYNQQIAVDNISFEVSKPTIVGILGPNGAGKSTFLKAALGLIPATGLVMYKNEPLQKNQQEVAYVEQKSAIDYTFPITVAEVVSLGIYPHLKPWSSMKNQWGKVKTALETVDMQNFAKRQIGELSGGQFQRVLLARTLVQDASLIFLDEPFVGIDATSEQIIMGLLHKLKEQGKTIFIVHHDLSKVSEYFDEILLLKQQKIVYGTVQEVFTPHYLKAAYGDSILVGGDFA